MRFGSIIVIVGVITAGTAMAAQQNPDNKDLMASAGGDPFASIFQNQDDPFAPFKKIDHLYCLPEDLETDYEVTNTLLTDPPQYRVVFPGGASRILSEAELNALNELSLRATVEQVANSGPGEAPKWLKEPANRNVEIYSMQPTYPPRYSTNYGDLTQKQLKELQDYIARRAIYQFAQDVRLGKPPRFKTLFDPSRDLTVHAILTVYPPIYVTDQGRLTEQEYESFQKARAEYRIREIARELGVIGQQVKPKPRNPWWWIKPVMPIKPLPVVPSPWKPLKPLKPLKPIYIKPLPAIGDGDKIEGAIENHQAQADSLQEATQSASSLGGTIQNLLGRAKCPGKLKPAPKKPPKKLPKKPVKLN
jgi:hypothetical protein